LIPYHACEALTIKEAAGLAKRSPGTLRQWAGAYNIGRRVGPAGWQISLPALQMVLDGDLRTLKLYHAGNRTDPAVRKYFEMHKLGHLLPKQEVR
jgi:hypothetical protein